MSIVVETLVAQLAANGARVFLREDGGLALDLPDALDVPAELLQRLRENRESLVAHLQAETVAASSNDGNSDTKSGSRPAPRIVIRRADGTRLVLEPATVIDRGRDIKPEPRETINPQRMEHSDLPDRERERWRRENEKLSNADLDTLGAMIAFGDPRARGRGWWF